MKRAYKKNNFKNFKITKEIEIQIMDLADNNLKGEKKHFIEKLVAENSNAENLYPYKTNTKFKFVWKSNTQINAQKLSTS